MGNRQTDIRSGVVKQRLKADGTAVGPVVKNVPRPEDRSLGAAGAPFFSLVSGVFLGVSWCFLVF